jgi:glycosyltransferase involved in cell wall biosynthesis
VDIIFCTDGIFPHAIGGMQRHSRLLIEEFLKHKEVNLIVIHPHGRISVFEPSSSVREIGIIPKKSSRHYLLDCYRYSKQVFTVLQSFPGAVVYSQGLSVWYGIKKIGSRVILNPHGLEPFQGITFRDKLSTLPLRFIFSHLFRHASKIISLGGRLTEILARQTGKPGKIVYIPNAVNVSVKPDRLFENEKIKLLFVGRFAHNKGIDILIEAIRQLNASGYESKLQFTLVGKGPLYDKITAGYRASNLHYAGFADDEQLRNFYTTHDIMVFPTLFEGMPTAVLEAMSYGMPVIVTDTGATTVLVNENNGYIIEKNNVDSLKNAIAGYVSLNAEKKKLLSENSFRKVKEEFTWPLIAEKYLELFRS